MEGTCGPGCGRTRDPPPRFLPFAGGLQGLWPAWQHASEPPPQPPRLSPTQSISQMESLEVRCLILGHRGGERGRPSGPAARPRAILERDGSLQASPRRDPRFLCCHSLLEPLPTSRRPAKSSRGVCSGPQGGGEPRFLSGFPSILSLEEGGCCGLHSVPQNDMLKP